MISARIMLCTIVAVPVLRDSDIIIHAPVFVKFLLLNISINFCWVLITTVCIKVLCITLIVLHVHISTSKNSVLMFNLSQCLV